MLVIDATSMQFGLHSVNELLVALVLLRGELWNDLLIGLFIQVSNALYGVFKGILPCGARSPGKTRRRHDPERQRDSYRNYRPRPEAAKEAPDLLADGQLWVRHLFGRLDAPIDFDRQRTFGRRDDVRDLDEILSRNRLDGSPVRWTRGAVKRIPRLQENRREENGPERDQDDGRGGDLPALFHQPFFRRSFATWSMTNGPSRIPMPKATNTHAMWTCMVPPFV